MSISVALRVPIPRYALWLHLHELGCNPEGLTREMALAFCDGPLSGFLAERGLRLTRRALRRLCKEVERYDPQWLDADEQLAEIDEVEDG
jgi:hypothetical protein